MNHIYFWSVLLVGCALIMAVHYWLKLDYLVSHSPLYVDVIFLFLCGYAAMTRAINIYNHFFSK